MNDIKIFTGQFDEELRIPFFSGGVKAGFPSPAQDYMADPIDFNRDLIMHPAATFYARVVGDSMINEGIRPGDIVVVDKSLEANNNDLVVAFVDGEFTLKRIDLTQREQGIIQLIPANDNYPILEYHQTDNINIWGVVIYTIHRHR